MATTTSQRLAGSYLEWSPVVAGTAIACAISIILLQFGAALGLSATKAMHYVGNQPQMHFMVVGLWLLWVQLIASVSGAYITGRLRDSLAHPNSHESEVRDGIHGLLVWAVSTLVAAIATAVTAFWATFASSVGPQHGIDPNTVQLTADAARRLTIIFGFGMAASAIVTGVASWWAAILGGDHRDSALDLTHKISFRKKKR